MQNKPPEFVSKYRQASGGTGSGLVPLLEDGDSLVIESDVVAKYVATEVEGSDGKGDNLYPEDQEALIEQFMNKWQDVTDTYYDLLRATNEKDVKKRQTGFVKRLNEIESLLKESEGPYILGKDFSYCECISAPWIQRFFVTMPYFRGVEFTDLISDMPNVEVWMKAVCERPSCIESRCPDEEMIAACKKYYVSYLSPNAKGFL